ncbi:MAG: D-Ala-D-Ala carboxypeptidase family metallohydrolase [Candidatus Marinamargulisbacteria bacterium]
MNENKRNNRPNHPHRRRRRPSSEGKDSTETRHPRSSSRSRGPRSNRSKNSKWNRYRISEHFMKRDFDSRKKDCACGNSLRISLGLVGIIEALRAKINKRIEILTGYYCPECRDRQYGIKRDFHHQGVAADIHVEGIPPTELFLLAETFPEIKGIGINFDEPHVHIDTRKEDERQCWVETNGEWIPLTDDNRDAYILTTTPPDATSSSDQ